MAIIILANQAALNNKEVLQAFAEDTMPADKVATLLGLIDGTLKADNFFLFKEDKINVDGYMNPVVGMEVTEARPNGDMIVQYAVAYGNLMVNHFNRDPKSWKVMLENSKTGYRRATGSECWEAVSKSDSYNTQYNTIAKHVEATAGDVRRADGSRDWQATATIKRVQTIGLQFGSSASIIMLQIDDKLTQSKDNREYYRLTAIKTFGCDVYVSGDVPKKEDTDEKINKKLGRSTEVTVSINIPTVKTNQVQTETTGNISLL